MRNPRFSIPANTAATLGSGNRGDTFRPFESGAYYNDATPTLSTPPATQKGCGALGTLIVVAVAVAVTIATGNALLAKEVATGVAWAIAAAAGSVASQAVGIAIGMQ